MRLLLNMKTNEDCVEELLAELPAKGVLSLDRVAPFPDLGTKGFGTLAGIAVDLLPGAVDGLFKTVAAYFQRPSAPPATVVVELPDRKLTLSFDPARLDPPALSSLVAQVMQALRDPVPPAASGA